MDRWTNGQMDICTERHMNRWTYRQEGRLTDRQADRWSNGQTHIGKYKNANG